MRANASYTIPWVDVLMGAVFQYRPGAARRANWPSITPWSCGNPQARDERAPSSSTPAPLPRYSDVELLDTGDIYGEGLRLWDLKFGKNIRFANKRLNIGVDIFNLFNSDAATGYDDNYDQYFVNGVWVEDNPATTTVVETQDWGGERISSALGTPRVESFDF